MLQWKKEMHGLCTFILEFSAILLCIDTSQLSSIISFITKNWLLNQQSQKELVSFFCTLKISMFLGSTERKSEKIQKCSVSPSLIVCRVV